MKTKLTFIFLIFSIIFLFSCNTQKSIINQLNFEEMREISIIRDTFNIEEYNNNKNKFGVYKTNIDNQKISLGFDKKRQEYWQIEESIDNPYYCTHQNFYSTGKLKERGRSYVKNASYFEIGIWEYYDEQGQLIKTEDYDAKNKISWKQALDLVYNRFHYLPEDIFIEETRSSWFIRCVSGKYKNQGAWVDKNTGKVEHIPLIKVNPS